MSKVRHKQPGLNSAGCSTPLPRSSMLLCRVAGLGWWALDQWWHLGFWERTVESGFTPLSPAFSILWASSHLAWIWGLFSLTLSGRTAYHALKKTRNPRTAGHSGLKRQSKEWGGTPSKNLWPVLLTTAAWWLHWLCVSQLGNLCDRT
jgi:hypothetical protein